MAITATLALGEGLKVKFFYGALLGGAAGFLAGKLSEYNPNSKFAEHLKKFEKELSDDSELSLNFYETEKNYSSPKTNYIDYETSKKEFYKPFKDNDYNYNYDNYYSNNSKFMPEQKKTSPEHYFDSSIKKYNFKGKSNTFGNKYGTDNYTSDYDTDNYTKDYD